MSGMTDERLAEIEARHRADSHTQFSTFYEIDDLLAEVHRLRSHPSVSVSEENARLRAVLELIAGMENEGTFNAMGSVAALDAECRASSMRMHARMQVLARAALSPPQVTHE